MSKKREKSKKSEIIEWYYNQQLEGAEGEELREKFELWIVDQTDAEEKERALDELLSREFFEQREYDSSEAKRDQFVLPNLTQPPSGEARQRARVSLRRLFMGVAAILLPIAIVAAILLHFMAKPKSYEMEWRVAKGATESVLLWDKTEVDINSQSVLNVAQNGSERVAELSGESYFRVTKEPRRKFRVVTNEFSVTVLGTSFNIENYPESSVATVTLIDGELLVEAQSGESWRLGPNQLFVYNKRAKSGTVQKIDPQTSREAVGWTEGEAVYNYRTLEYLFGAFERRFDVEVVVDDKLELGDNEYVIRVHPDDTIERVMNALKILTDKFDYYIDENKIVYVIEP